MSNNVCVHQLHCFVHAVHKLIQKVPYTKSGTFWFSWTNFHDSRPIVYGLRCAVVFAGMKFFHRAVNSRVYFVLDLFVQKLNFKH